MVAWRPKIESVRVCRPVVVDSHRCDKHQYPDPHYSVKSDMMMISIKVKRWIRIRILRDADL
jgi:hypothetical protein